MATRARGVTIKTGDESSVPQVELIGDWDLAQSLLNNLPTIVHAGTYAGMNIAAKEVVVIAKKMIRNGGPKWDAHSTAYQKRKKRLGGTNKPWYISGSLYKNIKVVNTRGKVFAGIPPGAKGKQYNNKQVTLNKVARILEKGSPRNNIKARPLFGPAHNSNCSPTSATATL